MIIFVGSKDKDGYDLHHHVICGGTLTDALLSMAKCLMEEVKRFDTERIRIDIAPYEDNFPFKDLPSPRK